MKKLLLICLTVCALANTAMAGNTAYIEQAVGTGGICAKYFNGGLQKAPTAANLNCDFYLGVKGINSNPQALKEYKLGRGYVKLTYEYCPNLALFRKQASTIKLFCTTSIGTIPLRHLSQRIGFKFGAVKGQYLRLRAHFVYDQFKGAVKKSR